MKALYVDFVSWILSLVLSVICGFGIAVEHGYWIGVSVGVVMVMLSDIRYEVSRARDA